MNVWHRPLAETLVDVFNSVEAARTSGAAVRVRSIELTLPIEVWLLYAPGEGPEFIADLPVWRWRTVFDQDPSRLRITLEEEAR